MDGRLREIFAPLGDAAAAARDAYAECLAGVRGSVDVESGHDRCRRTVLDAVRGQATDLAALDRVLQELEAAISADT